MRRFSIVFVTASIFVAGVASADEAPAPSSPPSSPTPLFGQAGHVALDDVFGVRIRRGTTSTMYCGTGLIGYCDTEVTGTSVNDSRTTELWLDPSIDYFVTDRVTVGGEVAIGYVRHRYVSTLQTQPDGSSQPDTSEQSGYELALRPRVGYVIHLADELSLWPRVGVGYDTTHLGGSSSVTSHAFSAQADLSLVATITRHAYFAVGPSLSLVVYDTAGSDAANGQRSLPMSFTSLGGGVSGSFGLVF